MFAKRFSRKVKKKQHPDAMKEARLQGADVKGFKISTSQKM